MSLQPISGMFTQMVVSGSQASATSAEPPPSPSPAASAAADQVTATAPSATAGMPVKPSGQKISPQQLQDAVKQMQKAVTPMAQELLFSIDKDTGMTVVKVMDTSTKEVIRQIPAQEVLDIAETLNKLQEKFQGLLIRQKA